MYFRKLLDSKHRRSILLAFDVLCYWFVFCCYILYRRFISGRSWQFLIQFLAAGAVLFAFTLVFRMIFRIYGTVWRYTNPNAYLKIVIADACAGIITLSIALIAHMEVEMHFFVILPSLNALLTLFSRFAYLFIRNRNKEKENKKENHYIPVAVIGGGQIGALLVQELLLNQNSPYRPVFFVDNDECKIGGRIMELPVYSEENVLERIKAEGIREIFFALPTLSQADAARLFSFYQKTGCKLKIYDTPVRDSVQESEKNEKRTIRDFSIEDLLFREPILLKDPQVLSFYKGKTILVTGGGGSIGSEICRQLAKCEPQQLIIFDIYENNAYAIQQELERLYHGKLPLAVEIGSVRDRDRLNDLFAAYRPEIVFHAAAHKHVPLMEHSAAEAIQNNVFGTRNVADMAEKYKTKNFILISTDKAVNPTNIMGASKRLCEMVVQCRRDSETIFSAVRFGNVLGSNGSVIPLFKQQISTGGPLTITDKRIVRYFMTIPEASLLVMNASAIPRRGELFVLNMGNPVRIYDLAVSMIRLSGLEPGKDIEIKEIGLRPGEKLYEELLMNSETLTKTQNDRIFIEYDTPLSRAEVDEKLSLLQEAVGKVHHSETHSQLPIFEVVKQVVPTFRDPKEVNEEAEKAMEMKSVQNLTD